MNYFKIKIILHIIVFFIYLPITHGKNITDILYGNLVPKQISINERKVSQNNNYPYYAGYTLIISTVFYFFLIKSQSPTSTLIS